MIGAGGATGRWEEVKGAGGVVWGRGGERRGEGQGEEDGGWAQNPPAPLTAQNSPAPITTGSSNCKTYF